MADDGQSTPPPKDVVTTRSPTPATSPAPQEDVQSTKEGTATPTVETQEPVATSGLYL